MKICWHIIWFHKLTILLQILITLFMNLSMMMTGVKFSLDFNDLRWSSVRIANNFDDFILISMSMSPSIVNFYNLRGSSVAQDFNSFPSMVVVAAIFMYFYDLRWSRNILRISALWRKILRRIVLRRVVLRRIA